MCVPALPRPAVLTQLDALLESDDGLRARLGTSLRLAHDRARADLDPLVLDALAWPTDPAWREPAPEHRYAHRRGLHRRGGRQSRAHLRPRA